MTGVKGPVLRRGCGAKGDPLQEGERGSASTRGARDLKC